MNPATDLLATLSLTAPIFCLIAIGYLAVRFKYFPQTGITGISAFVARVAVPVLIFKALAERDLTDILNGPYLLAYSLGSLVAFFVVYFYARTLRNQDVSSAAFYGMGGSFSNSIMVGFPLSTALFGEIVLVPFALTLMVENLLMMPLALGLASSGSKQSSNFMGSLRHILPSIARTPIFVAIILGMAASLLNLPLPPVVDSVMTLLANTVTGAALFAIGGMLVGMRVGGLLPDLSAVAFGKLVLHPLAVFAIFSIVPGMDPLFAQVAVVFACAPMFGIYAVLGEQYGKGAFCAAAMLPTTVISFLTISVVVWLLQRAAA